MDMTPGGSGGVTQTDQDGESCPEKEPEVRKQEHSENCRGAERLERHL